MIKQLTAMTLVLSVLPLSALQHFGKIVAVSPEAIVGEIKITVALSPSDLPHLEPSWYDTDIAILTKTRAYSYTQIGTSTVVYQFIIDRQQAELRRDSNGMIAPISFLFGGMQPKPGYVSIDTRLMYTVHINSDGTVMLDYSIVS